jgi:type VI secretion system protein
MSGGLLQRIDGSGLARAGDEVAAVLEHLRVLLATRQGSSASAPGYGLQDITDAIHSYPVGAQQIGSRIRAAIEAFEPRLAPGVSVELLTSANPLDLQYRISARLRSDRRRLLVLGACVSPDREIALHLEG